MDEKKQIDYKEYARQMRENCAKDHNGNVVCSGELWEEIANIIENFAGNHKRSENVIELPCNVGDTVYCIWQYNDFAKTEPPFIMESKVAGFVIDEGIVKIIPEHYAEMADSWHRLRDVAFSKEEAEAKMKGR